MGLPKVAIDSYVPDGVRRDVRRLASRLVGQGAKRLMVQVPAGDFAGVMLDLAPQVGFPFTPVLERIPCAPYAGEVVCVIGSPDGGAHEPVVVGADGRTRPLESAFPNPTE